MTSVTTMTRAAVVQEVGAQVAPECPNCRWCRLVAVSTPRRYYHWDDHFFVVESASTATPLLVARRHINVIPLHAFQIINLVAARLFGSDYSLEHSGIAQDHYTIRVCPFDA